MKINNPLEGPASVAGAETKGISQEELALKRQEIIEELDGGDVSSNGEISQKLETPVEDIEIGGDVFEGGELDGARGDILNELYCREQKAAEAVVAVSEIEVEDKNGPNPDSSVLDEEESKYLFGDKK